MTNYLLKSFVESQAGRVLLFHLTSNNDGGDGNARGLGDRERDREVWSKDEIEQFGRSSPVKVPRSVKMQAALLSRCEKETEQHYR